MYHLGRRWKAFISPGSILIPLKRRTLKIRLLRTIRDVIFPSTHRLSFFIPYPFSCLGVLSKIINHFSEKNSQPPNKHRHFFQKDALLDTPLDPNPPCNSRDRRAATQHSGSMWTLRYHLYLAATSRMPNLGTAADTRVAASAQHSWHSSRWPGDSISRPRDCRCSPYHRL